MFAYDEKLHTGWEYPNHSHTYMVELAKIAFVQDYLIRFQSSHSAVQPLQIALQVTAIPPALVERLLRPRLFIACAIVVVGYRDLRGLACSGARTGLNADHLAEAADLVQNHALHFWNFFDDFKLEVESCWARRLVGRVVPDLQVPVFEGLFD